MKQSVVKERPSRRARFFVYKSSPSHSSVGALLSPLLALLYLFKVFMRYSRSIGDRCHASV